MHSISRMILSQAHWQCEVILSEWIDWLDLPKLTSLTTISDREWNLTFHYPHHIILKSDSYPFVEWCIDMPSLTEVVLPNPFNCYIDVRCSRRRCVNCMMNRHRRFGWPSQASKTQSECYCVVDWWLHVSWLHCDRYHRRQWHEWAWFDWTGFDSILSIEVITGWRLLLLLCEWSEANWDEWIGERGG